MEASNKELKLEPIGSIFQTGSGGTPLRSKSGYYGGNVPWLKSGELQDNMDIVDSKEHITNDGLLHSSAKIFPKNTVVIAMYGATTGKVGILGKKCSTNQAICGILPNNEVLPEFVYYYLLLKREEIISKGRGGAQPNISQELIRSITFPIFQKDEQKLIIDEIEKQFTRLEHSIDCFSKIKKKLAFYKETLLKKAFTNGFDKNIKFNKLKLENFKSNDKNAIKRGPFGSAIKKAFFVSEGYKVYQQKNAIRNDFEIGDYYINEDKFKELYSFELKPGDLIVSCSGTIGKIAVAPKNIKRGVINQALLKISLDNSRIITKYFIYLFQSEFFQREILKNTRGSAMLNISSVKDLKKIEFPMPNIERQEEIVNELESRFSVINKVEEVISTSLKKAEMLKKSILKSAFEGNLINIIGVQE